MRIKSGKIIKSEAGYALAAVLICLSLGATVIATTLSYANTIIKERMVMDSGISRMYAADAGVEDAVMRIKDGNAPRSALPQDMNNAHVTIQVINKGYFVLYAGEWVIPGTSHENWLLISSSLVWEAAANAYKYTVTLTRSPSTSGNITLSEVGVCLPPGFVYQANSAAISGNLSSSEPAESLDDEGNQLLQWVFSTPQPKLTETESVRTQTFYIAGGGSLTGYYAWTVAAREDIGTVSDLSGDFFVITSTATGLTDGKTTTITSDVMKTETDIYIISWTVSP